MQRGRRRDPRPHPLRAGRVQSAAAALQRHRARPIGDRVGRALAESRGQRSNWPHRGAVSVFGDFLRLEQAARQPPLERREVLPSGAPILVTVAASDGEVSWSVADRGHGIQARGSGAALRAVLRRFDPGNRGRDRHRARPFDHAADRPGARGADRRREPSDEGSTFRIVVPTAGPEEAPTDEKS